MFKEGGQHKMGSGHRQCKQLQTETVVSKAAARAELSVRWRRVDH